VQEWIRSPRSEFSSLCDEVHCKLGKLYISRIHRSPAVLLTILPSAFILGLNLKLVTAVTF
jgi:hypothetical protein